MNIRTRRAVAAVLALCIVTASQADPAQVPQKRVSFHIDAPSMSKALLQFTKQSRLQLAFTTTDPVEMRAPKVVGVLTPTAALDQLLRGTGLKYEFVNDRTVSILKAEETAPLPGQTSSLSEGFPVRLAQASNARPSTEEGGKGSGSGPDSTSSEATHDKPIEQVVVTGTHIRGASVAGGELIVLNRERIDRSGRATAQEVLNTLTENWVGGLTGDATAINFNSGTVVNLRGLGADSTLVLVDGRRQAAGGINGSFVDISSIATSAIERIEVLTDGASAVYGSDAVGGVVNIIMRKDFDGAETQLRVGTLDGDARQNTFSQLLGRTWSAGNVLLGYQYFQQDALARADRRYTASQDLRGLGGSDFRDFTRANPGNILCPAGAAGCSSGQPAFAIPSGQDGSSLTAAELLRGGVNYQDLSEQSDLEPEQKVHSAFLTASHEIRRDLRLFVEARFAARNSESRGGGDKLNLAVPATNPFFVDPFGGRPSITVAYSFLDDLGPITNRSDTDTANAAIGLDVGLSARWSSTLTGSYSKEEVSFRSFNRVNSAAVTAALRRTDPAVAFNPFGEGSNTNPATLAEIRFTSTADLNSEVTGAHLVADGPLFALRSGDVKLAAGLDYRKEDLATAGSLNPGIVTSSSTGRRVSAAFAELAVPLIGDISSFAGARRVELSLAGRYEEYSDFGSTFNPKIGLRWLPSERLALRGSWGTSFKAPRLVDRLDSVGANPANRAFIIANPDPLSPSGRSNVLFRLGGNSDLKPEEAETWSAGAATSVLGIEASVNYFNIRYEDRIAAGGGGAPLLQEAIWGDVITRNPDPAEVAAICNGPNAFCFGLTPAAIVDGRLRNLSLVQVNGLDWSLNKTFSSGAGRFAIGANGTYVLHFERKITENAPALDVVDTVNNPPQLRVRGSFNWNVRQFSISAFINYVDNYIDDRTPLRGAVSSWTTTDLYVAYEIPRDTGVGEGMTFSVAATNLFAKDPPFVDVQNNGYDFANASLLGRALSAQVTKRW